MACYAFLTGMMELRYVSIVLLAHLLLPLFLCIEARNVTRNNCTSSSPLVGFTAQLSMLQHQLRGQIQVLDDCSFEASRFDMIAGEDVYWWGAKGEDFENITNGFVISEDKLDRTFSNETLVVTLVNCTWEEFRVLGVWDRAFDSDFGHINLPFSNRSRHETVSPSPSPGPEFMAGPPLSANSPDSEPDGKTFWGSRQPTMFDNCIALNNVFRLRWTLDQESQSVDLGLEAAVAETQYMAFGWARPGKTGRLMMNADVVIGGFKNRTAAFVEDYYITQYSECTWGKGQETLGVCPDFLYPGTANDSVSDSKLLHGQWKDGVALIRYNRSLQTSDSHFDVPINATGDMIVIWALGQMKLPDTLRPFYLPERHPYLSFGHIKLNLSRRENSCAGPLQALTSDARDLIVADTGSVIVVGVGSATHYPNPPNPEKVFFLNKIEAPVLKVERGVQVRFSIQAGHDVAFCITTDPVGGAFVANATVFAGGSSAHGVPASPHELEWLPDRNTPDEVFYQSYFQKKMGWKVQVVDGGLADMYNSSVYLADQVVMLFWVLTESGISFAVRGLKKSGYVAIGFGETMVKTFAYVGWLENHKCQVGTYWIDGRDASSIHPTRENLTDIKCTQQNGMLTFQFSRPLEPACTGGQECKNVIDPSIPLKVVWAMGTQWRADQLTSRNMHSSTSTKYMAIHLTQGSAEAEQDLQPVLAVHGFMMFLAWALLLPGGVLAARYLKHLKDNGWFQIHVYSQYSGIAVMLLGVLFAVAELRGFHTESWHVKFGLTGILLACGQPINALFRPNKHGIEEQPSFKRVVWELIHLYSGRAALAVGFVSLLTGISELSSKYGGKRMEGLGWAVVGWFLCIALLAGYLEYRRSHNTRPARGPESAKGTWVMANTEEDDSSGLLQSNHVASAISNHEEVQLYPANGMEVQLQSMR